MRKLFPFVAGVVALAASCDPLPAAHAQPPPARPAAAKPAVAKPIDTRTALPLLPMMAAHQRASMRDHLLAVQEITAALSEADFDGVAKAAKRLGSSDEMQQQCTHMGAAAPGFTERALEFHRTADGIGLAATHKNPEETLRALSNTLARCTSCHQTYRQEIVDDKTWSQLTGTPPPAMHHHGSP